MLWIPRTLGVLTALYGLATIVRPAVLAKPAGLSGDEPSTGVSVLTRAVGARDVANGVAVALAPSGPALQLAVAARIAGDLGDAATFALAGELDGSARRKAVGVSVGWAALNVLALVVTRRA